MLGHVAAARLELVGQPLVFAELLVQELGGALQHHALGAALALEARDEGGEAVEGEADGLAPLLLCGRVRKWNMKAQRFVVVCVRDEGIEGLGRARGRGTYRRRRGCSASRSL